MLLLSELLPPGFHLFVPRCSAGTSCALKSQAHLSSALFCAPPAAVAVQGDEHNVAACAKNCPILHLPDPSTWREKPLMCQ